jgi:hypothetical protein
MKIFNGTTHVTLEVGKKYFIRNPHNSLGLGKVRIYTGSNECGQLFFTDERGKGRFWVGSPRRVVRPVEAAE